MTGSQLLLRLFVRGLSAHQPVRDPWADFDGTAMWFSRLGVGALLIPEFDSCWIVNQIVPRQLAAVSNDDRRSSAISKDRSWRTRFWSWFPLSRRPMIISMEKRILRLEDEFWRIRTDTGELTDAERDALKSVPG